MVNNDYKSVSVSPLKGKSKFRGGLLIEDMVKFNYFLKL
jgi:hypothetical protein